MGVFREINGESPHRRGFLQSQLAAGFAVATQLGISQPVSAATRVSTTGALRNVAKITTAKPHIEGAGVHLHRGFGFGETAPYDPFLLLDDFRNDDPRKYRKGFPWHPHRGIETITYVLAGEVEHADSLGNRGTLGAGDVQWMTAGSGILHQEMPKGDEQGRMHGFQLWANLPAKHKMTRPRYQDVQANDIPAVKDDDGTIVRVICGKFWGKKGPVDGIATNPRYLDVYVPPNTTRTLKVETGRHAFAYVFSGAVRFQRASPPRAVRIENPMRHGQNLTHFADNRSLVLFDSGDSIHVETREEGGRFLLVSGEPIREPVAWQGPIVMNTQAELDRAFRELRNNTFIRR